MSLLFRMSLDSPHDRWTRNESARIIGAAVWLSIFHETFFLEKSIENKFRTT